MSPDLKLLNVQNREITTLDQVCEDQPKLVFRYFAVNCEECISDLIKILQLRYGANFFSKVVLLNDSYIKTYSQDSIRFNEYYLKNLNTNIDNEKVPYFFIVNPIKSMNYDIVLVCDMSDINSTQHKLKSILYKDIS